MSDRTNTPEHYRFYGIQPVLEVRDVVATAEWYRDVLGFTIDLIDLSAGGHARVSEGTRTSACVCGSRPGSGVARSRR